VVGLEPDRLYRIRVEAYNRLGTLIERGSNSGITYPALPQPPAKVKAEITAESWANGQGCYLTCDLVQGNYWPVESVAYLFHEDMDGSYRRKYTNTLVSGSKNKHLIQGLVAGNKYYFGMVAKNASGESIWVGTSIDVPKSAPTPDSATLPVPVLSIVSSTDKDITLEWDYPSNISVDEFEVIQIPCFSLNHKSNSTTAKVTGRTLKIAKQAPVLNEIIPCYQVRARQGNNYSLKSATAEAGLKVSMSFQTLNYIGNGSGNKPHTEYPVYLSKFLDLDGKDFHFNGMFLNSSQEVTISSYDIQGCWNWNQTYLYCPIYSTLKPEESWIVKPGGGGGPTSWMIHNRDLPLLTSGDFPGYQNFMLVYKPNDPKERRILGCITFRVKRSRK